MEEEQRRQKNKQAKLTVIGLAILIIGLIGVTYAFFNYTRTGTANTISTGQINFLSTQSNTLNITNVFPIASNEVTNANLDEVEIRIEGDTTYSGGEEFEITIEGLTNTIGTSPNEKTIPINFIATYTPTASGENIGTEAVSDYYSERGSTTTVYELTENGVAENGKQVLVGYIPANGEIDGTLKISAYIDSDNIAISDTYNGPSATPNDNMGTTSEWVGERVVLTTTEWNNLQNSEVPLSFKIKTVSQEGEWVEGPVPTIESCPGCKFIYTTNTYYYSANNITSSPLSTLQTFANNDDILYDDYREVVTNSGNSYFLGFKFDENGAITNAYACGIKGEDPNNGKSFCIEGALKDTYGGNSTARTTLYNANTAFLNQLYGSFDSETGYGCNNYSTEVDCIGSVGAGTYSDGDLNNLGGEVHTISDYVCIVSNNGNAYCYEN